jgi:uncharacterized protein with GYD domain
MATHIVLMKLTDQGIKDVKNAPQRIDAAAKAVEAYRRAEELSNTLAMSNLANIYIDAGL